MTRREFVTSAGAMALGAAAVGEAAAANKIPIVDTHQHLWDLNRFKLPWLATAKALDKSYLPADYAKATAGLNVVKAVYMEVDVTPEQQVAEADYLIELCESRSTPTVAAVISGRPGSSGFAEYIRRYRGNRYIKGVRQVLHPATTKRGTCLEPQFVKSVQLLGDLGMSYDLCMRSSELADGLALVKQCPNTRFIVDHCGNANVQAVDRSQWTYDLARLADQPNTICKVSGIVASAKPGNWTANDLAPIVRHVLNSFGMDRVIFGGDWPVCTLAASYSEWLTALNSIIWDYSYADRKKLFHDNAVRFYGL